MSKVASQKKVSAEYVDRISRILLAFCSGMRGLLPQDQALSGKLRDLSRVVEKTISEENPTGLSQEIGNYFEEKKIEDEFRFTERKGLVGFIRELTLSLKGLGEPAGEFDQSIDEFINGVQSTDSIQELTQLKEKILVNARQVKKKVKKLNTELENSQKVCDSLQTQLEKTEANSILDSLTRVLNRSAFSMRIEQVISEFKRFNKPCTLSMIDIDFFKKINDVHGHQAGDKALTSIANTIKHNTRESDSVFRYGGEEFVVLFPETNLKGAQVIAEKVRNKVSSVQTHLVNDVYADKDKRVEITISLGLAELRPGDTSESWFKRADEALYRAKEGGRNRTEVEE